jgi:hypothetical protein
MGFRKPNLTEAECAIRRSLSEIHSPFNDGYTQMSCKQELYMLKYWLDDEYNKLPTFAGEEKWAQERLVQILKQK